jgi:3,4-dihydroxy 2-butanone 4-phosphate synthase/GTP cyclohydrolase II
MAQPGGVLVRAGHTEGGSDLARMAGLKPASVIVEILNEDGSMARRPDLEKFAQEHDLKIGTIADLIHYRVKNEKTIERVRECPLSTEFGEFRLVAFQDKVDNEVHLALVMGEITPDTPTLVRVHMQNILCDIFHTNHPGRSWPLSNAMRQVAKEGAGVIVVLRNHDTAREIIHRMRELMIKEKKVAVENKSTSNHLRTFGVGAQILSDLGVRKMRVLSSPKAIHGLSGFDLEVVEYVDCE